jgi:hypothetical protein
MTDLIYVGIGGAFAALAYGWVLGCERLRGGTYV